MYADQLDQAAELTQQIIDIALLSRKHEPAPHPSASMAIAVSHQCQEQTSAAKSAGKITSAISGA